MSTVEFTPFEKIARLNRDITITEKIDGTNAAVVIVPMEKMDRIEVGDTKLHRLFDTDHRNATFYNEEVAVFAQSRNRFVTPENDNYGFARWVQRNAVELAEVLGEGRHFGEWWGSGIQSKYGLTGGDKRFSLFNTGRWGGTNFSSPSIGIQGLGVVPVLYEGPFSQGRIDIALDWLHNFGSQAAPGFMKPEGIVVYHHALRSSFKVTLEGDEAPKGAKGHALDEERAA